MDLFLVLMELNMVSDPWPLEDLDRQILDDALDYEAKQHGCTDWIEAYHKFLVKRPHQRVG